jgi:Domain of unknown function (DUF4834)
MRDIIWTVIVVWIVWKIYDSFKTVSKPKTQRVYNNQQQSQAQQEGKTTVNSNEQKKKPHLDPNIGEYVDYEEVK